MRGGESAFRRLLLKKKLWRNIFVCESIGELSICMRNEIEIYNCEIIAIEKKKD